MHQRKFGDPAETRTGHSTPPARDRSGLYASPSPGRKESRKKQQRLLLKSCFPMTMPLLAVICLIILIWVFGFVWTLMSLQIKTAEHFDIHNDNVQHNASMAPNLRGQKLHEMDPTGKEIQKASGAAPNHQDSPFQLVSEGAPECSVLESPDDITVTLVTQVSHNRLWMMKHQCDRYRNQKGRPNAQHKMSIAVYSNATLDEILDELREMDCGVTDKLENNDEALVVVSVLDGRTHGAWNDYPVNELRNLALSKVQTTHILYIDVDFWPSENLYEFILGGVKASGGDEAEVTDSPYTEDIRRYLFEDPKLALVIPAFQLWRRCNEWIDCPEDNLPHMEASRTFNGLLQELVHNRSISIFDPKNKGGHGSTDYKEWFYQPAGSLHDIECLKSNRYEPYVLVRYCQDLPPFQTVFSGYGKNKLTWIMQLVAEGYVFSQVGRAHLVHYPHLDSASRQHWNETTSQMDSSSTRQDSKRAMNDQLFVDFKKWLSEAIPVDRRRIQICDDSQNDDAKLWVSRR